jgi:hypothetical protein
LGLDGLGNRSRAIALRQLQNASANDLLQAAFGATGNKIPYPPRFRRRESWAIPSKRASCQIVDCESDIVQSDFAGSVSRKIKVLNDLGAFDGYDHASEGGATVVPRRELRVCDRRILAAKRTQSIDSPGLAN